LKAFIPEFIPAVGEVDAFLKMPKPNQQEELLGLTVLDEPCLNQSKKAVLIKKLAEENYIDVHTNAIVESVRNADKNPKEIMNWINDISKL